MEEEINKFFVTMSKNHNSIEPNKKIDKHNQFFVNEIDDIDSSNSSGNSLLDKRITQSNYWMLTHLHRQLISYLEENKDTKTLLMNMESDLSHGKTTPRAAANKILEEFIALKK